MQRLWKNIQLDGNQTAVLRVGIFGKAKGLIQLVDEKVI